jgi:hypothetical protein
MRTHTPAAKYDHYTSLRRFRQRWSIVGHTAQFLALFLWVAFPLGASWEPDGSGQPVWYEDGVPAPENAPSEGPDVADYDGDTLPGWYETYIGTNVYNPDTDGDLVTDADEITVTGTDPLDSDTNGNGRSDLADWLIQTLPNGDYDGDGLTNVWEATHLVTNWSHIDHLQYAPDLLFADTNGDGWTDGDDFSGLSVSSIDADNDGLTNGEELTLLTGPKSPDSDSDDLPDGFEVSTSLTNPRNYDTDGNGRSDYDDYYNTPDPGNWGSGDPPDPNGAIDSDGDGLSNDEEASAGTNPTVVDTDSDGLSDGAELGFPGTTGHGTDPLLADTDGDELSDGFEVQTSGTNPLEIDSDGNGRSDSDDYHHPLGSDQDDDGLTAGQEIGLGTDPADADSDGDGLADGSEVTTHHTNPVNPDTDGDGLGDGFEIETSNTSPLSTDSDSNGRSDYDDYYNPDSPQEPDPDSDGDGLNDSTESAYGTNPELADTDGDGLSDGYEIEHDIHYDVNGVSAYISPLNPDSDSDGLSDGNEVLTHNSSPAHADTDGDALSDIEEIQTYYTNPCLADTDADGLSDAFELQVSNTQPTNADSDGNGISDYEEYYGPTPPETDPDNDGDGLSQSQEGSHGTDPDVADTDGDGLNDGAEVLTHGSNPLVSDSDGDTLNDGDEVNTHGTLPLDTDTDDDTVLDGDEVSLSRNPLVPEDSDGDDLPDHVEIGIHGTDPLLPDTDGDLVNDGAEVAQERNPLVVEDVDLDGLPDHLEAFHGTAPNDTDTDDDGLTDAEEVFGQYAAPTNPVLADTDGDTLTDGFELNVGNYSNGLGSDPSTADYDGDELNDAQELAAGTSSWSTDTDGDTLSDAEELNVYPGVSPLNAHSLNAFYTDYYMVDTTDSDGGGIPNRVEEFYGMNTSDSTDDIIGDLDNDGMTNFQAWQYGWDLRANYDPYDIDRDRMTNVWEQANAFNPEDRHDGVGDPDGDGLFNFEEAANGTDPRDSATHDSYSEETGWVSIPDWIYATSGAPYPEGVDMGDNSTDWDHDGYGNFEEVYLHLTDPRDGTRYPGSINNDDNDDDDDNDGGGSGGGGTTLPPTGDFDGDGMTNGWESAHGFNPTDPLDAYDDPDGDFLFNIEKHLAQTDRKRHAEHPWIGV